MIISKKPCRGTCRAADTTVQRTAKDFKVGEWYEGKMVYATTYGVFFDIGLEKPAMCHKSELHKIFVEDCLLFPIERGEKCMVRVLRAASKENSKINISLLDSSHIKPKLKGGSGLNGRRRRAIKHQLSGLKVGEWYDGEVVGTKDYGNFFDIGAGKDAMCHVSEMAADGTKLLDKGEKRRVRVVSVDTEKRRIDVSLLEPKQ